MVWTDESKRKLLHLGQAKFFFQFFLDKDWGLHVFEVLPESLFEVVQDGSALIGVQA